MAFQVHHVLPHEVVDLFRMRLAEIFPSGRGIMPMQAQIWLPFRTMLADPRDLRSVFSPIF